MGAGPEGGPGYGEILRRRREARGLTRAEVAEALRLSERVVEAIEGEDAGRLPAPAFVRGYLRAYARLVGADEEAVLAAYRAAGEPGASPEAPRLEPIEIHRGWGRWLRWGTAGAVAALAALVLAWWRGGAPPEGPAPPPAAEEAAAPATRPPPAAPEPELLPAEGAGAAPAAAQPRAGAEPAAPPPRPAAAPAPRTTAPERAASAGTAEAALELRLRGTSWVEVRDATGRRLVYDLLRPGTVRRVRGRAPFRLVLGEPTAVEVRLDGEEVPLAGARPGRTLRVTVGAAREATTGGP